MENNNQNKRKLSNDDDINDARALLSDNVSNKRVATNNFYSNYAKLKAINICNQLDTHNYDVNIIRLRDALTKNPTLNFKSFQHLHRTILHILAINKNISITEMIIRELIEGLKFIDSIYYLDYKFNNMDNVDIISKFINEKDDNNCTALHYASRIGNNLSIIDFLIKNGADVNVQDNCGFSPLHYASQVDDNSNILKYLMDKGAMHTLKNKSGINPLYFMCASNNNLNAIKHIEDKLTIDDINFYIDNRTTDDTITITKVIEYSNMFSNVENVSLNTFILLRGTSIEAIKAIELSDKIIKNNTKTHSIILNISDYDNTCMSYFKQLRNNLKDKSTTNA